MEKSFPSNENECETKNKCNGYEKIRIYIGLCDLANYDFVLWAAERGEGTGFGWC